MDRGMASRTIWIWVGRGRWTNSSIVHETFVEFPIQDISTTIVKLEFEMFGKLSGDPSVLVAHYKADGKPNQADFDVERPPTPIPIDGFGPHSVDVTASIKEVRMTRQASHIGFRFWHASKGQLFVGSPVLMLQNVQ